MSCLNNVFVHEFHTVHQFILEASSASIVWGRYYFVTTIRPFGGGGGVLLLGRVLLIGTLRYLFLGEEI